MKVPMVCSCIFLCIILCTFESAKLQTYAEGVNVELT